MRRACLILVLVALFLGGSTGVVFAGHALNSPVATTNPGDFWVSGNMDCDGTSVWDGVATFNADAIFSLDVSVGADLAVAGDLDLEGNLDVDKGLTVAGALEAEDELGGARVWLPFGESGGFASARYLDWAGNNHLSVAGEGAPMMHAGSVIGVAIRGNISKWSAGDSLDVQVRVNGDVVFTAREAVASKGFMSAEATQARGIDTFSAGDYIALYVPMGPDTLTIALAGVTAILDLQLDD